jgi:23S rRNA (pseudouridine1915-N3)-methyltransferase
MHFKIIWPGKTRDANLLALSQGYLKRLSHFVRCEVAELRESPGAEGKAGIDKDSKRISDALRSASIVVVLDPDGVEWSSQQLAAEVERWETAGTKEVAFVVGGPRGISKELKERADKLWSLSRLTMTHEMARVFLLEQLYRAFTIKHGLPYQK